MLPFILGSKMDAAPLEEITQIVAVDLRTARHSGCSCPTCQSAWLRLMAFLS